MVILSRLLGLLRLQYAQYVVHYLRSALITGAGTVVPCYEVALKLYHIGDGVIRFCFHCLYIFGKDSDFFRECTPQGFLEQKRVQGFLDKF